MSTTPGDFTPQAQAYARARPGYPSALIDRLLEAAGVPAGGWVVDVGAGTGLFTEQLAARNVRVDALEPNEAMRAGAPALEGVRWSSGSFERTGLDTDCADWIVAAQAFHWADPARALPELDRIRKPGRWFTALWNNRHVEASPLLAYTRERIQAMVPDFDEGYRDRDWAAVLRSTGHFAEIREDEAVHTGHHDPRTLLRPVAEPQPAQRRGRPIRHRGPVGRHRDLPARTQSSGQLRGALPLPRFLGVVRRHVQPIDQSNQ